MSMATSPGLPRTARLGFSEVSTRSRAAQSFAGDGDAADRVGDALGAGVVLCRAVVGTADGVTAACGALERGATTVSSGGGVTSHATAPTAARRQNRRAVMPRGCITARTIGR
jgi:hypothetical protein